MKNQTFKKKKKKKKMDYDYDSEGVDGSACVPGVCS